MFRAGPAWATALAVAVSVWSAAIWTAPAATPSGAGGAALVYLAGSFVCHQRPERSFHVAGAQLPVCARCASLYTGGALGMLGWMLARARRRRPVDHRRALWWLAAASVPAVVSVSGSITGWWDGTNLLRAAMSMPFGVAVGAVVAAVVARDLR